MLPQEAINIFKEAKIEEADLYYVIHPSESISREDHKKLKEMGFNLQKYNIWIYNKWKNVKIV